MVEGDIFKIKPIGGKNIVVADKRKLISPFNAAKHLKDANIPAYCDQCVYRSVDSGGNGKCPKYEKEAVCSIREDYINVINLMDTRKPDDIKAMLDMIAKLSFENVLMALTQAKMDGNIPDRNTKSEINTLLNVVKAINDLNTKVVVTEGQAFDEKTGDITSIFKQIKAQRST
tara:strand:+ start:793 stop:1311 length:519 start_codon:yes stop_codon:yes gene_type:complete